MEEPSKSIHVIRLLLFSAFMVVLTVAPSCKSTASASETKSESFPVSTVDEAPPRPAQETEPAENSLLDWPLEEDVVFTMKRTPCLGSCKVYNLRIWNDGTVSYNGSRNVERIGRYRVQVPAAEVEKIIAKAMEINFFDYAGEYPTGDIRIMDLPSTISTLTVDGKTHQIINRNYPNPDVPEEIELLERLGAFESYVDEVVAGGTWTKIGGANGNQ